ncbi:MAG TPA: NUDIX hydrolase [Acidimicrobiia bacterium]|nr:NUDIX hydrolase [Acidimicrobiia bacterium]
MSLDTVRFPDGSTGELEMVRHSGASAILPLLSSRTADDPQILLLKQFRYAAAGYIYEVPAGRPDKPGEEWEVCARRELQEETGLIADDLTHLTTIFTTPGFTDEKIHIFLAENLREGKTAPDADEFIETVRMPISEALRMVRDGEISDAKTICALLHAAGFVLGR